ncbi:MAG: helix-turn-helix transcriptional regulator [Blautia sp.]|nr:helix-turn-helix transcriptional regulator [Lachnoclostridium sp.]MCM1210475.1 helix-turn-helix transcriptional regulator [Blautia sp.]
MEKELFTLNNYGHIQINLREYMDKHEISRNALARAVNTRFEVIDKWYKGNVEKIDADVLARICFVLNCSPGDIIMYISEE